MSIGQTIVGVKDRDDQTWIGVQLGELAADLDAGAIAASSCSKSMLGLKQLGYLDSQPGKDFVEATKAAALADLNDLDDFEVTADLIAAIPELFGENELWTIRNSYARFINQYADECDLNPEETREAASRVGNVGTVLGVPTDEAESQLHHSADQRELGDPDFDDDDFRGGPASDVCSDGELDSMFGTLGSDE